MFGVQADGGKMSPCTTMTGFSRAMRRGYRSKWHFPKPRGCSGFERKISNRLAFEAVPCRERTGYPWHNLPMVLWQ